ncbi:MAG: hypothetical protein KatS3mg102_1706 [Planctomycetota bacterium]|nr:MAG: hypothetical protein KatS3mg102_1706 [Planctomycetota bacterium]
MLAHAALFALAFHPAALWPLAFLCAAPLGRLVGAARLRQALLGGFAGFLLGGGAAVHWLALFGLVPWLATAFGFGLYGLLFATLARPMARAGWPALVWLPLAWVACESLRGRLFFWAFPWFYLGHAVYPLQAVVQVAELGGQLLVSLLVAAWNGLVLDLWNAWRPPSAPAGARPPARTAWRRLARLGWLPLAATLAAWLYGAGRLAALTPQSFVRGPEALAVQPHIPQRLKNATDFDPMRRLRDLERLTRQHARSGGSPPDLVVWPETMLPVWRASDARLPYAAVDQVPELQRRLAAVLREAGARRLIAGSLHAAWDQDRQEPVEHNSAFYLDASGTVLGRYDKMHLAPVSEYTPLQHTWPAFYRYVRENFTPGFSQFERGRGPVLFELDGFRIAPNVCFDITFSSAVRLGVLAGADAIVNVSNYAWFEDSAELDLARIHGMFRAIETRRGVLAAVNGGISHLVDPAGRIYDLVRADGRRKQIEGALRAPLLSSPERTFYVRYGDWPGLGAVGLAVLGALAALVAPDRRHRPAARP